MKKSSRTTGWLAARALVATMAWLLSISAIAAEFKVLVVMSYEEDNPWVKEIREGIEGVLSPSSEIRYSVTELERRGITPKPMVLKGATLVRGQP